MVGSSESALWLTFLNTRFIASGGKDEKGPLEVIADTPTGGWLIPFATFPESSFDCWLMNLS